MTDRIARVWNGSSWESITSTASSPNAVLYYQPEPPPGPATGTVWLNTEDNQFNVWNGESWIAAITTYSYQEEEPENPILGQIWVDSTSSLFYVWDGSSWVQTQTLSSYQELEPENSVPGQIWIRSTDRQILVYDSITGWRRVRDNSPIKFNYSTLSENVVILGDRNAFSVGPILIEDEVEVEVQGDAIWCII
jgi:hypothetical protein